MSKIMTWWIGRALALSIASVLASAVAGCGQPLGVPTVARAAGSWGRAIEVPGPALNTGGLAGVTSVSCGSAGNCAAGGTYFSRGVEQVFVANERDGHWGQPIEIPGMAAMNHHGGADVTSVSCAAAGTCAAGGYYTDSAGVLHGFVANERHGAWGKAIEVPGLTAPNRYSEVLSVSCGSAGNCVAGGDAAGGGLQGFVAGERKGIWGKAVEVPGLAALRGRGGDATVTSVSCATAGNCAAGGSYHRNHHHQGFVVVERSGQWGKAIEVPDLAALNAGGQAIVKAMSCASAGNCAAVGDYTDRKDHLQGFVAVERNGVWRTAIEVPGLGALNTAGPGEVLSVSCGSADSCLAGGYYSGQRSGQGFLTIERDGRWGKAIQVPGLAAIRRRGGGSDVTSVSCGSAGNCAVGGDYSGPRSGQNYVAVEKNGRWRNAIEVPGLSALSASGGAAFSSISCAPAGTCAAGGSFDDRHHHFQGYVVSQTG